MEKHSPKSPDESTIPTSVARQEVTIGTTAEFIPGTSVIYALHGKCNVLSIETRQVGSESIRFYKLEIQRSNLSRSSRQEPAIWVPVTKARERGMRSPLTSAETEVIFKILANREYYFEANASWSAIQPKLESSIHLEGAVGLAKVLSYLFVLKRRQVVASSEVTRMFEAISKFLFRELSEATGEHSRTIEDKVSRSMRHKLLPDA